MNGRIKSDRTRQALRTGLLLLGVSLVIWPGDAAAAPGPGEKEYCFCLTPKNNQNASGVNEGGLPSRVRVKWRGMWFEVNPGAGDTPADIMQDLADQIEAAFPGDTVGPITVDPITGRVVFCVKGPEAGIRQVAANETDSNFRECTFRRVRSDTDSFLRRVGGAFVSAEIPQGGGLAGEVLVENNGAEEFVTVFVETFPGQEDLNGAMVQALADAGFLAYVEEYEWDDGEFRPTFFIDAAPGPHGQVEGFGITTNDLGISDLSVLGEDTDPVPTVSQWGLGVMVLLLLTAGAVALNRRRVAAAAA